MSQRRFPSPLLISSDSSVSDDSVSSFVIALSDESSEEGYSSASSASSARERIAKRRKGNFGAVEHKPQLDAQVEHRLEP